MTFVAIGAIFVGAVGWILAFYFAEMYGIERRYARSLRKLHTDALKHWDETRQALKAALFPAAIKSPEKEFKS